MALAQEQAPQPACVLDALRTRRQHSARSHLPVCTAKLLAQLPEEIQARVYDLCELEGKQAWLSSIWVSWQR